MTASLPRLLERFARTLLFLFPVMLVATRAGMDITLSLIGCTFLCSRALLKDGSWLKQPEVRILLLLWAYVTISAWWLTPSDAGNAAGWVRFIVFYAAIRYWLLSARAEVERYAKWLLMVLAFVVVDTYAQYFTGSSLTGRTMQQYQRLTGPLKHANIGNYLLKIMLPLSGVWLALSLQRVGKEFLIGVGVLLAAIACLIPLTGERTITILFLIAILFSACLCFIKLKPYRRRMGVLFAAMAAMTAILVYTQPVIGMRFAMLEHHVEDFQQTPYGQLFSGAWLLAKQHPLVGIGYEQYYEACIPLRGNGLIDYCDIHPHNTYLQLLVETGIIGFALFLAAIAALALQWWRAWRTAPDTNAFLTLIGAGAALLACFFPVSVTQSVFSNWSAALMWFCIGLAAAAISVSSERKNI